MVIIVSFVINTAQIRPSPPTTYRRHDDARLPILNICVSFIWWSACSAQMRTELERTLLAGGSFCPSCWFSPAFGTGNASHPTHIHTNTQRDRHTHSLTHSRQNHRRDKTSLFELTGHSRGVNEIHKWRVSKRELAFDGEGDGKRDRSMVTGRATEESGGR
jgi:hypothetical protein